MNWTSLSGGNSLFNLKFRLKVNAFVDEENSSEGDKKTVEQY
jgi:hypothetical protein